MHGMQVQLVMGELRQSWECKSRSSKMLLMQAQENGVTLDEEQFLFIAGGQDNAVDEDVNEQPVQDLALSVDNVFQADDYILSEVHNNDHYQDAVCDHHEPAQYASLTTQNNVVDKSLTVELVTYKEQIELYERRAKFELTKREQKIDEQLRIGITDRNIKEKNLKMELHSLKLQLTSTINHNKSMVEEVKSLKKDFKQKENKYLEEFLDMKALKEKKKVAIGYKNPLCLTRAKQVQLALYNGHEIIKTNHVPAIVHNSEDTLEISEITRKKINDKMKDPEYKMADENVPAPAPTRSDDQILPFAAWVPIGKSNYNTNFFRAFTASASVPAIYIQQFWNTLTYEAKTRVYSIELDESRFVLDANLLREALEITPVDQAHQFVSPPSGEAIMDFVNELGYTEGMIGPDIQFFRCFGELLQALMLIMLNLCGKNLYKLSRLFLLLRSHNIHQRSTSPFHLAEEDLRLGNLKFVPKGEEDEVFGMLVPNEMILNNIRNAPYYNAYLEMVAKHDQKVVAEKEGKKKYASTKQPNPKPAIEKSSKPAPAPKPKVTKEKPSKASTAKLPKPKLAKE
ncbi:hypothetical protein Tco_1147112 [Tanacetum coccineum]